ncbi:MAG: BRO family protein [Bacteroidales bacterium]|nr:BRO family protein [Bacteroidales bacterium]
MSEIRIFENPEFGKIRTMELPDGQVGFVGKDVAEVLGYSNTQKAILVHVDEDDKLRSQIGTSGQRREMMIINESGLYSLILSSKLPQAKAFKRWVTNVVLPQIRKTGGYIPVLENDSDEAVLKRAVEILMNTVKQKENIIDEQAELLKEQHLLIGEQNIILEEQQPLVEFAQTVGSSQDTCTVAELAKLMCNMGIEMGQNRLFGMLRDLKYLGTSGHHWNVPQQRWIEAGYFVVKTSSPWYDKEGNAHYSITPLVTGKGQQYFINKFRTV